MHDDVIRAFRERVRRDAAEIREESAVFFAALRVVLRGAFRAALRAGLRADFFALLFFRLRGAAIPNLLPV